MSNKPASENLQLPSPDVLARRIRDRCDRMLEHNADIVRLAMANGKDLIEGRSRFTAHGTWLPWLHQACKLKQRQALNYVTLAQHRPTVEAYLQRGANSGVKASIRGALDAISPPEKKPKRPKTLAEIETPAALGPFLNSHRDAFWQALALEPELKAEIAQRLTPEASGASVGASAQVITEVRAILALLKHPTEPNVETVRAKASRIVHLLDPTPAAKPMAVVPTKVQLDRGAFNKALSLNQPDLDIPEFLRRAAPAGTAVH